MLLVKAQRRCSHLLLKIQKLLLLKISIHIKDQTTKLKEIANKKYRSLPVEEVFPQGAGAYHSINYIPNAIGLYIARLLNMTVKQAYYSAKISALIINASIISFSFFLLRKYRSKFLVLIVALYPQILISLSSISADGIINATSLLFGTIILKSLLDKKISLYL